MLFCVKRPSATTVRMVEIQLDVGRTISTQQLFANAIFSLDLWTKCQRWTIQAFANIRSKSVHLTLWMRTRQVLFLWTCFVDLPEENLVQSGFDRAELGSLVFRRRSRIQTMRVKIQLELIWSFNVLISTKNHAWVSVNGCFVCPWDGKKGIPLPRSMWRQLN